MSYGKKDFWNQRYSKKSECYDWYQRYDGIKDIITQYLDRKEKLDTILNVGSGTSCNLSIICTSTFLEIPERMYQQGYEKITSIDISKQAVKVMKQKYAEKYPGMTCNSFYDLKKKIDIEGDIRNAQMFKEKQFDIIIDKGTFDTILCSEYSRRHASSMLNEVYRILKPEGTYLCISYGLPQKRIPYFEQKGFQWKIQQHKVTKSTLAKDSALKDADFHNYHYIYAMTKLK